MADVFVKYYSDEEDILFYVQYKDNWAVRQIEISPKGKILLSEENPAQNESMLADQPLTKADLELNNFITKEEFEAVWNEE